MSKQEPMKWLPSREEELVEEALAETLKIVESNVTEVDIIKKTLEESVAPGILDNLIARNLVYFEGSRVCFTDQGSAFARRVLRRCRLSERLLVDVLNVKSDNLSAAACQFEHVLSAEITDSICTLLGHPKECPHHHPIPPGDCCQRAESVISSVVIPLHKMEAMREAKIAYMLFKSNSDSYRLMSLGLHPGQRIRLLQSVPNFIVEVGEGQVAFDEAVAKDIYIRPL